MEFFSISLDYLLLTSSFFVSSFNCAVNIMNIIIIIIMIIIIMHIVIANQGQSTKSKF